MQIRCPHCQVAIELIDELADRDVSCPSCGSRISSDERARNTPTIHEPVIGELPQTMLFATPSEQPESAEQATQAHQSTAPQRPPVIEVFGRFRLLKRLGSGAFGEVFWAYDPQLDRDVAIKRPHKRRMSSEALARFNTEAQAAAQLRHPCIVGTYEVDEVDGRPYIASEYILGTDLAARANAQKDQNRLLPPRDIALLCAQVSEALHVAHEAGIVHRDLKPANILIGADGLPRVMDFGMAKRDTEEIGRAHV